MDPQQVVSLAQDAITITLILAGPVLVVGMVVGVLIALFQAVTQIQEMTLTFVPKIVAVMLTMLFLSSWLLIKLTDYTHELFTRIPYLIR